jgi:hypothetical protein
MMLGKEKSPLNIAFNQTRNNRFLIFELLVASAG